MKNMRLKGFSLSEVVLTMAILGVVMLLSTSPLILTHERNSTQAGFADSAKEINKALFNYSVKNQCQGKLSCTNLFDTTDNNTAELLSSEFLSTKKGDNCWDGRGDINGIVNLDNLSCFVDGKGRIYATQSIDATCATDYYGGGATSHKLKKSCGYIYVDLNGKKAPNIFGRDLFMFIITDAANSYLYPNGGSLINPTGILDNWTTNNCTPAGGITCAGRIIEEGWKVKYLK